MRGLFTRNYDGPGFGKSSLKVGVFLCERFIYLGLVKDKVSQKVVLKSGCPS